MFLMYLSAYLVTFAAFIVEAFGISAFNRLWLVVVGVWANWLLIVVTKL
jgi:hypothetical protein